LKFSKTQAKRYPVEHFCTFNLNYIKFYGHYTNVPSFVTVQKIYAVTKDERELREILEEV